MSVVKVHAGRQERRRTCFWQNNAQNVHEIFECTKSFRQKQHEEHKRSFSFTCPKSHICLPVCVSHSVCVYGGALDKLLRMSYFAK